MSLLIFHPNHLYTILCHTDILIHYAYSSPGCCTPIIPPSFANSGAVLAITLSQSSTPFFLLVYIWACGLHKQTWGGWSWESLVDWWTFTKLALPGLLMFSLKWWSNEVGIIIIGMIGKTELAMYTISVNITLFLFLVGLTSFIMYNLCHILILLTSFQNDHFFIFIFILPIFCIICMYD